MSVAYLKLLGPEKDEEQVYQINSNETVVGRSSDADFVLNDLYVSRHHARIVRKNGKYQLVDLNSTHGTFINGQRVEDHPLRDGDQVRLGRKELLFGTRLSELKPSTTAGDFDKSLAHFSAVLDSAEYSGLSDLEKINFILDFKYQSGQQFSSDETFAHILRSALNISGAERGCVFTGQGDGYVLGLNAAGHVLSESKFSASRTVVAQVAESGVSVFMTEGIEGELAQQQSILEMHLRAIACLPLKGISAESDAPEVLGILYLDSTSTMHALSGLDEKILNKLAGEAGNVLEKLEMIKSFEERKKFEQEMTVAYETQKSLLPHSLPEFGNFGIRAHSEPTRHVGGDFYYFFQPNPDKLIGVLADVSGKGVPAALLSSMLQGALDMECRTGVPPEKMLERVNQLMCERSASYSFVTLFLFSFDAQGKGEYLGAGHNPVYLYRAATDEIEELHSEGLILGAFESVSYNSRPLQLNPGDVLVVYSDGVTDAENPQGEMFEEERFLQVIQSNASAGVEVLKEKILEALDQFTEGMAQTDDITFVLIDAGKQQTTDS
ncbi:MAG: SpoIIE family protein phosphatase [Acidobacteria bacterium]|nr:SpoIIE family protein phosphatase [Acidobacteriota bacterium]